MPANPAAQAAPSDSTDAPAVNGDAEVKATRTRTNREGPTAPQQFMSKLADALLEGVRVYGTNAPQLCDYIRRLVVFPATLATGDSAKMSVTADVLVTM